MNFSHIPDKELITGTSGSGKTTLLLKRIRENRGHYKFVFDAEGQIAFHLKCRPALTLDDCNRQIMAGVCVFNPSQLFDDVDEGFEFFCDYTFTLSQKLPGKKWFYADEVQDHSETHYCSPWLRRIAQKGRWWSLDVCCISQQPNELHNKLRNTFTRVSTFQQIDDTAFVYLKRYGFQPDQVRALPPGQFITRYKTGEEVRGEVFKAKLPTGCK